MQIASTTARSLLALSSLCALIVICALVHSSHHGTTNLCSTKKCFSSLVLPDDSADIAAAKASMELEASVRHQKLQNSLDVAQAQGDAIADHIRRESAAFLARMRHMANATIRDSPMYSSAPSHPFYLVAALLGACFIFIFL